MNVSAALLESPNVDREEAIDPLIERLIRSVDAIDRDALTEIYHSAPADPQSALVASGLIDAEQVADAYCGHYLLPRFDPPDESFSSIDASVAEQLPAQFCVRHRIVPLSDDGVTLEVAIDSPDGLLLADDIRFHTGRQMRAMFATPSVVTAGIVKLYGLEDFADRGPVRFEQMGQTRHRSTAASRPVSAADSTAARSENFGDRLSDSSCDRPTIFGGEPTIFGGEPAASVTKPPTCSTGESPMDWLMARVVQLRADQVQLQRTADDARLRFRIDGRWTEVSPPHTTDALIEQLEGVTNWTATGPTKIQHHASCGQMQVRVHRCEISQGRSWTLHFIRGPVAPPSIDQLTMNADDRTDFLRGIEKPRGLTIVAGPCDSGKSETLYAALSTINDPSLSVFTVEQSVRYQLPGVVPTVLDDTDYFGLHDHLQSILCQSPDVLLVHQIRDAATADLCVRAAEGGRRVLVSVPSIDCASALRHLESLGISAGRIGQTVRTVVAQRRLRRLCDHCKMPHEVSADARKRLGVSPDVALYQSGQCKRCMGSGYQGRITAYEVMRLNSRMSRKLSRYNSMQDIESDSDSATLRDRMMEVVASGQTSLQELRRVL